MGTFTINSYSYYNISTDMATGDTTWTLQAESGNTPGYLTSSYTETGAIDDVLSPNETLDPDYSASNATYLGNYTYNGNVFTVFSDEFGQLLGTFDMNVPYSSFPPSFNANTINAVPTPFCFLGGTKIATPTGEICVEDLKIGDQVLSETGHAIAVKWVGQQIVRGVSVFTENLAPVCIRAGVLGNHCDLYVSADHGMIVDGYVINASALVNGDTIRFVPSSEMPSIFTYYHVETESHDVILANGAPAESFVDAAGRAAFDNYQEYLDLYGVERVIPEMDRLRISSQRLLPEPIKARLGMQSAQFSFGQPKIA